jgi:hypothetical protein
LLKVVRLVHRSITRARWYSWITINWNSTPHTIRCAVISVVHLFNYIGLGGPVIGVGFLSLSYGLLAATRLAALVVAVLNGRKTSDHALRDAGVAAGLGCGQDI